MVKPYILTELLKKPAATCSHKFNNKWPSKIEMMLMNFGLISIINDHIY